MKKSELIQKLENGLGTIFSKQDVINMINDLQGDEPQMKQGVYGDMIVIDSRELEEIIKNKIEHELDNESHNWIDHEDCTYQIRHGNKIELEEFSFENTGKISDEMAVDIMYNINEFIKQRIYQDAMKEWNEEATEFLKEMGYEWDEKLIEKWTDVSNDADRFPEEYKERFLQLEERRNEIEDERC